MAYELCLTHLYHKMVQSPNKHSVVSKLISQNTTLDMAKGTMLMFHLFKLTVKTVTSRYMRLEQPTTGDGERY